MAPVSTKKEQERSKLYSSHGNSASKFNTDEIRRYPASTSETLERKQGRGKKTKSASAQQQDNDRTENSRGAKVSRISDPTNGLAPKDDVLILPDNFKLIGTTKSKCSDPLDELCKKLRVPYTVIDVATGPLQAQDPITKRIDRRSSEEYGGEHEVSIKTVEPDHRSPAQQFWDSFYPAWLLFAGLVSLAIIVYHAARLHKWFLHRIKSRSQMKAMKDAQQAEGETVGPALIGTSIELENINQVTDPVKADIKDSGSAQRHEWSVRSDGRSTSARSSQTLPLYQP
ncbi:hypothetical protein MMC26_003903 [Xylographa opegraphella]|nr:hypothetical protein [Xylographa opegraphella]